jgi:heme-degrading monooxygenase HmoA
MITLINVFTVEKPNQQRLIELLTRATDDVVCKAPGFISATLYRGLDGAKITMHAQWRSLDDYQAMRSASGPQELLEQALAIAKFEPGRYEVERLFAPAANGVQIVENFWREVWQQPQDPEAIDRLVHEDFIITSGGRDIRGREAFKAWVKDFQSKVQDFQFSVVETFQNDDGSRVASRWRVTGGNNGLMGTAPNGAAFEMTGTAIWEVGRDGLLRHNWVERNSFEVHGSITREVGGANVF